MASPSPPVPPMPSPPPSGPTPPSGRFPVPQNPAQLEQQLRSILLMSIAILTLTVLSTFLYGYTSWQQHQNRSKRVTRAGWSGDGAEIESYPYTINTTPPQAAVTPISPIAPSAPSVLPMDTPYSSTSSRPQLWRSQRSHGVTPSATGD